MSTKVLCIVLVSLTLSLGSQGCTAAVVSLPAAEAPMLTKASNSDLRIIASQPSQLLAAGHFREEEPSLWGWPGKPGDGDDPVSRFPGCCDMESISVGSGSLTFVQIAPITRGAMVPQPRRYQGLGMSTKSQSAKA